MECTQIVHRKVNVGVMGKGRDSYRSVPGICGATAGDDGQCNRHRAQAARLAARLAARKAAAR